MGLSAIYVQIMVIAAYLLAVAASWGCRFLEIDVHRWNTLYNINFMEVADPLRDRNDKILYVEPSLQNSFHDHMHSETVGLGLFSFHVGTTTHQHCTAGSQYDDGFRLIGDAWKVASASAWAGNILIGLSMFLSFCLAWFHFSKAWRLILATTLVMGSFCEALTVVAFADDVCHGSICQLSTNAILSIAASIVAFVSAVMVLDLGPV